MIFRKQFWRFLSRFNWIVILAFWFYQSADNLFSAEPGKILYALAGILGLSAGYSILVQFFLMSRNYWLERAFGLDKLSRLHHDNGRRSLYFLVGHALLIVLSYSLLSGSGFFRQFWLLLTTEPEIIKAFLAWVLFLAAAGISVWTALQNLRYEIWYLTHLVFYAAILLAFSHQFELGDSLTGSQWFYYYWVLLYAVVFLSLVLFRVFRPAFNYFKHGFRVSKVVPENHNVTSIYISGKNLDKFKVLPGQFMIFRFLDAKRWWEAHPFSLSKPNDGKEIRLTPKAVGNFTKELNSLKSGTKVIIEGPYGVFTNSETVLPKVLLIAGGIGITPLRSLAEEMRQKGKDVVLLFSNKTKQDIVFEKELEGIQGLKVFHVLTDAEGYLDAGKIQSQVPDFFEREVFLCGPGPMMSSIRKILKETGHPTDKLHFERFSL